MGRLYLKSITATALLFLFVAVFPQRVEPSGLFELDLVSLSNSDGREVSGGCCSGLLRREDGSCPGECPVSLRFCISHYQSVVPLDASRCTFFEFSTDPLRKGDPATAEYDVAPQRRVSFDMEFGWPNDFTIIIEAWHQPTGGGYKNLVDRFVGQRYVKLNSEWTRDNLTTSRSSLGIRYRVVCKEFYYGEACERLCRPRNGTLGHYTCSSRGEVVCLPGWGNFSNQDHYCRQPLCNPTCKNGYCIQNKSIHECKCFNGWKGAACDVCVKSFGCKHGKCETNPNQCLCDEGWGGYFCELDLNFCTNAKPCQNGGTCTNTAPGSFTCKCPDDFIGKRCEAFKNPCRLNPCENGATCNNPSAGQYTCTCAPSYFGNNCETWAKICADNQCVNGGTCIQDPNGFICSCPLGYEGTFCEKINSTNCQVYPCRNGGTCVNSPSGFTCMCAEGVRGSRCEETIRCSPDSCENGGTCRELKPGSVTCDCPPGYSGPHCQHSHNRCATAPRPCHNGATCHNRLDGEGYSCTCPAGYTGPHCNIRDHCASSPCRSGESCRVIANGFQCGCPPGGVCPGGGDVLASNVSHRISSREDGERGLEVVEVVLICVLSATLVVIVLLVLCVTRCVVLRRRRREEQEVEHARKEAECNVERLQNERNLLHMNNKGCGGSEGVPGKIVNELDTAKRHASEAFPPKVLNMEAGGKRRAAEKGGTPPRAFQKIDNTSSGSISFHSPRECSPPCHSGGGGIYVIEDHLRSPSEDGPRKKDILATEV